MKRLLVMIFGVTLFFCEVTQDVREILDDKELARFYEDEIGEMIKSEKRVEREYDLLDSKVILIYEPNPNYTTTGVYFNRYPLAMLFSEDMPMELEYWMFDRIKRRISSSSKRLLMDNESKWIMYGLRIDKDKQRMNQLIEKLYADIELAQYFENEFRELSKSEVRVEKRYEVYGFPMQVIYNPEYIPGKSGIAFKNIKLLIRSVIPTPKKVEDWLAERAHPIPLEYGCTTVNGRLARILFGIKE